MYGRVSGRRYRKLKGELSDSDTTRKIEKDFGKYSHIRDILEDGLKSLKKIYEDLVYGDKLTRRQAGKLEKKTDRRIRASLHDLVTESAVFAMLFLFLATGVFASIYQRRGITGFATFAGPAGMFGNFGTLLGMTFIVFALYLFLNKVE